MNCLGISGIKCFLDPQISKSDSKEAESFTPVVSTVNMPEPEDDFEVADMEIDNVVVPAKKEKKEKKKKFIRMAAGQTWEDQSLLEWDPGKNSGFTIFLLIEASP